MIIDKSRVESFISIFVTVHPHETSALISSTSSFFFILSAYFVVLPLRDEGAISLGLGSLPGLFVGSLLLTLVAAPVSTLVFSLPNLSKGKALFLIHRFFSWSLVIFFVLWLFSTPGSLPFKAKEVLPVNSTVKDELKVSVNETITANSGGWENHGWFYIAVRIAMFLWVALLNLITISSTWARVIDVMDNESGSRLFGFIGAGATLGQLFGSLFATGMAWFGPYLLLVSALLLEFAAQSSVGIKKDISQHPEELSPLRKADTDHISETDGKSETALQATSPRISTPRGKPQTWVILEGLQLILSSTYLLQVALFLWLSALVSSFFYFQKVTVIASTVASPVGRRRLFAQINSFIAVFILGGQLTLTGHILTVAGVTAAICSAPLVGFLNLIALSVWPSWIAVAVSETLRKVVIYVVARPGRELLFTVVTQDEKYKAKVCIDVIVQRLGDATAAGMYKLLLSNASTASTASIFALPHTIVINGHCD
ncbi:TLC ATP/ADP transporter [Perilla frutescens var. hirtella]|nr:TLC ATP/ADP transporter [Perilla frutescens var. hirtella]